jgi:DNA-binding transcriptional ArsR family regulator
MVKFSETALDATFGALADPTRRAILAQLALGETSVTAIASRFDISLPGVTKHLRVLEAARLLSTEKTGRVRRCKLELGSLRGAAEWISYYQKFWEEQLDSLAGYFDDLNKKEKHSWPQHPHQHSPSTSPAPSPRRRSKSSTRGPNRKS